MSDQVSKQEDTGVDEIDLARAQEYTLLSTLLLRSPDTELLQRLEHLRCDDSALGRAHQALAECARRTDAARTAREFFTLFVGVGRGELMPYASYYLTGFHHGRPLAKLRQDLLRLGIERAAGQSEPEDHAGILLETMAALAGATIPVARGVDRSFFDEHVATWMGRFFSDLECASAAHFYAAVGKLGSAFVAIERQGFELMDNA
jgi:TorA maturation chaperone TorD